MALTEAEKQTAQGNSESLQVYGNADTKVSPYLKAWIAQPDWDGKISTCVVGLIGPGTARSLQSKWSSPFEQSNVGGKFEKTAGIVQAHTSRTSISTFSSTQIWEGNAPSEFNLTLLFYALSNAKQEVMYPLRELEAMMGPNVEAGEPDLDGTESAVEQYMEVLKSTAKSLMPGGRIPQPVMLNIGRTMLIPNCVIESMSVPLDKERTKDGDLVRAEVTLTIATKVMLNRDNIRQTWP